MQLFFLEDVPPHAVIQRVALLAPTADKNLVRRWSDPHRRHLSLVADGNLAGFDKGSQVTLFYPTSCADSQAGPDGNRWCRTAWDDILVSDPRQLDSILIKSSDQGLFCVKGRMVTARVLRKRPFAWYRLRLEDILKVGFIEAHGGSLRWQIRVSISPGEGQSTSVEVLTRKDW